MRLLLTALASMVLLTPAASRQLTAIRVSGGDDLQAAINAARPGDTILLQSGARFVGNFELPNHGGNAFITIRTEAAGLPGAGVRTGPAFRGRLATLQSGTQFPALRTAPGAHHWQIENVAFAANADGAGDIITLGDGSRDQSTRELVPHSLVLDRLLVEGDEIVGQKRGIALNSAATEIRNSYIAGMKARGQDSQAIAGWNGPGPFRVENNYLEAAGENILFGGGDPAIDGLVPEDIVIRRNYIAKPPAWRGTRWSVKNLLELKNARNVRIEGNVLEHSWAAAQDGFAILFTPQNQDGRAPWAIVENVRFSNNLVRHVSAAFNISGIDPYRPSARTRAIAISNNLFLDVSAAAWGGSGDFLQIGNAPADVVVEDNTAFNDGRIVQAYGGKGGDQIEGFVFRRNVMRHNRYGVKGDSTATGLDTLARYFPGAIFVGNVIAGNFAKAYPEGNRFVSEDEVRPGASFAGAGVNMLLLESAIGANTSAPVAPAALRQNSR